MVEILSEHTESIDRLKKKYLYEKHGVREYRIIDPSEKIIEQFVLKESSFQLQTTVSGTQKLPSVMLDEFTLAAEQVF